MVKMTKKMLAVALMAGSVLVLAGCNNTPAEPDDVVMTGEEMVVTPEIEVLPGEENVAEGATSGEEVTSEEVVEPVVAEPVVAEPVEVVAE